VIACFPTNKLRLISWLHFSSLKMFTHIAITTYVVITIMMRCVHICFHHVVKVSHFLIAAAGNNALQLGRVTKSATTDLCAAELSYHCMSQ